MAGLRFNIDADLTRFSQLVKRIQEVRKEMENLSKFSPKYDKLYDEFKKIKSELNSMQKKFAEIQTALAQIDISKGIVDESRKIRNETEETSETIKHYTDSLNGMKEQLRQVTNEIKAMSEADRKSAPGENAVKQYASLKAQLKVAADEMRSFAKEQENIIKVQQASDGSLTQLRRQLSLLTRQYDNLSREFRQGATGKELIAQIQTVTKELNEAEQASMRFYRNVGNYASGWNGLNVQVQQLVRELPSATMGLNMFFLAISNNLPMLVDEIKLAKDRLAELKAEGKQGTPVWQQLAKSLLSWQTALVVGITLLSSYGDEIADWVKGLFNAADKVDILKEALKAYNETVSEGRKNAQAEITELKLLYDTATDAAKSTDERTKSVKRLKEEYPDYFRNLSDEAILTGKAKDAYDALSMSILNYAKAQAIVQRMIKNNERLSELSDAIENAKKAYNELAEEANEAFNFIGSGIAADKAQEQLKIIREAKKEMESLTASNSKLESEFNAIDFLTKPGQPQEDNSPKRNKAESDFIDTYQRQKAIRESEQDIADTIEESQRNAQKMAIDLMEEGNAKELAQINADYDNKISEIRKRERELLQTLQDAEYERWRQENPDYKEKGLQFTPTITALPPDKQAGFGAEYSAAYQQQQNDTARLLSGVLAKYRDFAAQIAAVEKQLNDDIAFMRSQRTAANSDEIDRAIQVAKDKAKESIKAIKDEEDKALAGQDNTFLKMLFGDISQMGFSQLSTLIEQARQLRDYLSGNGDKEGITFISPQQLKAIEESPAELDKLRKALDKLLGTGKSQNKWDTLFESFKKGFADLKSAKGFKEISGAIGIISGAAGQAAGEISSMFEAMGKDRAANVVGSLGDVLNAVSNIGQAFATGGVVGGAFAAVGEIFSLISKGAQETAKHRQTLERIMNDTIAQQREYNLLLLEQNLLYEKASTIFGTDSYAKAKNAVDALKDSIASLNGEMSGSAEQQGRFSYKKTGMALFDNLLNKSYSQLKDEYSGLADIEIKTGSYTTGAWFWKKQHDVYSSILDVYPDLIDANGEFNKELAESIVNTREMSDEDKAALQNMIELAEQAEEAFESLNDYMTGIFGDLGSSMSDALVNAFKNGTDAAESFTQSVSDMLETLAEQMIYSVTIAPLLEQAQKEMMEVMKDTSLTDEQRFKQWTDILNGLVDDAVAEQDTANRLYEAYQKAAEEKGFDIFKPEAQEQQQASSKGFATASQDSIDELNGRFTALQITGEEIKGLNEEQLNALLQIYEALPGQGIYGLDKITSIPYNESDINNISSRTGQMLVEGQRSPQTVVTFPTVQLDALIFKMDALGVKIDDLVRFGADNTMSMQTIEENTGKMIKQIPQQGENIVRTINNKL